MTHRLTYTAVALSVAAFAVAAPAMAQQETPWSGVYAGALLGGAWGEGSITRSVSGGGIPPTDITLINATSVSTTNHAGFTGGGELGYNYLSGALLLGLETDFTAVDVNQTTTSTLQSPVLVSPPVVYTLGEKAQTDWMWTVRPRIGYVAGPWLFYGTAGFALSEIKVRLNLSDNRTPQDVIHSQNSSTRAGWTAGAGVGYAISQNWSVKTEFLYSDFGGIITTATSATGVTLATRATIHPILVRLGIDYRF